MPIISQFFGIVIQMSWRDTRHPTFMPSMGSTKPKSIFVPSRSSSADFAAGP